MQVLIINMARSSDRMAFQSSQMHELALSYTRIEAVTPAHLTPPANEPIWQSWQRPLKQGEMALLASHIKAWRHVVDADKPCLILEDDAVLSADLSDFLDKCHALNDVDLISLETRGRKKIVGTKTHAFAPIIPLYQDRTGSAAYVVWPKGAAILLEKARKKAAPSDAFITSTYQLAAFQADPALAIQLDHCAYYTIDQPIEGTSILAQESRVDRSGFSKYKRLTFRLKRILGQIRMGLRQLIHLHQSEKRHIEPSSHLGNRPS